MAQRFDPVIKQWVDHYNTLLKPDQKLDPNIVKMKREKGELKKSRAHK